MDHSYSDLEEGEIIDDSPPPPPDLSLNRKKQLPQRYSVRNNKTPLHKHKRNCKHSTRHHAKKLSKLQKSPVRKKNGPKQYHKPPPNNDKGKTDNSLLKNISFPRNSLIAEMKGSLKSISPIKKLYKSFNSFQSQKILKQRASSAKLPKNNVNNSVANNINKISEHLTEKTALRIEDLSDISNDSSSIIELDISNSKSEPPLIDLTKSPEHPSSTNELNCDNDVKNTHNVISNMPIKEEESEDEEELRRIALATCAKRKALREATNIIPNVDSTCSALVPDLTFGNDVQAFREKIKNPPAMDNYEVVDMEVDDDMQDSQENQQIPLINQQFESAENLFVIDTSPSKDFLRNMNSVSETQAASNSDDEDFEVNLLRAQLLTNLNRKKFLQEHSHEEPNVVHKKRLPVVTQKVNNYQKLNLLYSHKRLKSAKHFLRKRSVNKLVNINNSNNINKVPLPVPTSKPSERLIIRVNGESSDDSDNSDEETNTVPENPVDSIVALISDCRQKAESNMGDKKEEIVPKAVSCLSKAQQEEYNSLMKILAEKKKLSSAPEIVSTQSNSVHSPLEDLKKLEGKLVTLRGALKNKKNSMTLITKEVNAKRSHYMKAKLHAQHLKEQWVAAEKLRKSKLLDWMKTCDNFKLMKKSVSNLESKIDEVQNLCSKLGSSLQGQTYKLPVSSGNEQS